MAEIIVKTVWHLEKEGRKLFIDRCPGRRGSTLVITSVSKTNRNFNCEIRATTEDISKDLRLRKALYLTSGNYYSLGPFLILVEPATEHKGAINLIVDDGPRKYYYLSSPPEDPRILGKEFTILLPADVKPDIRCREIFSFIQFSGVKEVFISGEYSEEWKTLLPPSLNVEIKDEYAQMIFRF